MDRNEQIEWLQAHRKSVSDLIEILEKQQETRDNIAEEFTKLMEQNLIIERLKRDE